MLYGAQTRYTASRRCSARRSSPIRAREWPRPRSAAYVRSGERLATSRGAKAGRHSLELRAGRRHRPRPPLGSLLRDLRTNPHARVGAGCSRQARGLPGRVDSSRRLRRCRRHGQALHRLTRGNLKDGRDRDSRRSLSYSTLMAGSRSSLPGGRERGGSHRDVSVRRRQRHSVVASHETATDPALRGTMKFGGVLVSDWGRRQRPLLPNRHPASPRPRCLSGKDAVWP